MSLQINAINNRTQICRHDFILYGEIEFSKAKFEKKELPRTKNNILE